MIELTLYFTKSEIRYVVSLGHGSDFYGQAYFFSLVREIMDKGKVYYAKVLLAY